MKNESMENTIITLHGKGWSIRRISGELFISRRRIRLRTGIKLGFA
jgi:hypothetical protein